MGDEQPSDPNVLELHSLSSAADYGTMLRLASTMELTRDFEGFSDLWDYLKSKGFEPLFVEKIAKPYWRVACRVVERTPYRHIITEKACLSERRLMGHFLRLVCQMFEHFSRRATARSGSVSHPLDE